MTKYQEFLKDLELLNIELIHINSDKSKELRETQEGLRIEYQLQYMGEPQINTDNGLIRYQLKIEINLFYVSKPEEIKDLISKMVLGYLIDFKSSNIENFQVMYKDPEIKEFFTKGQIVKTLWPFIRQLHIDLSNRHNLQVPPLPWIK